MCHNHMMWMWLINVQPSFKVLNCRVMWSKNNLPNSDLLDMNLRNEGALCLYDFKKMEMTMRNMYIGRFFRWKVKQIKKEKEMTEAKIKKGKAKGDEDIRNGSHRGPTTRADLPNRPQPVENPLGRASKLLRHSTWDRCLKMPNTRPWRRHLRKFGELILTRHVWYINFIII